MLKQRTHSQPSACCCLLQGGVLLQLSSLLAAYQARNVTTVYDNSYPVWQVRLQLPAAVNGP